MAGKKSENLEEKNENMTEAAAAVSTTTTENGNREELETVTENTPEKKSDMVQFRLFQDNDKYKAPVFVGVNGVGYLVMRGEPVEMPRAVYEVLMNSENQIYEAGKYMHESEYKEYK